ncbi:MAG: glutamate--tRNA ligase [Thermoanaerobaculia bacterium]
MRLRFAPSPTGFLHVGGARTAIFNLLHARRHGGKLLLRIEDTDVERSRQHHAEQIVTSLAWLGVDWDEGPLYQSDRLDLYRTRAFELVEKGLAYRCYCTVEELEAEREAAEKSGGQYRYSGRCRTSAAVREGQPFVIRFKVDPGPIDFHDLIRGDVHFEAELIDDFVLLRSDGHPTYHLSVVVDDIDMRVTHVARGDDHLSNTPKHILLFRAFGADTPVFAHLPLILGTDKKRLSKRFGATSVEEYQSLGILPEALFNFLTLLGWSPGGDREIMSKGEAIAGFDLSDVNKAPAVFDQEKLTWLNAQYMAKASPSRLADLVEPFLDVTPPVSREQFETLVALHVPRSRTLREMAAVLHPYFVDDDLLEYEPEAVAKHVKDDVAERMRDLHAALATVGPFGIAETEAALRALAQEKGTSAAKYIHPLRLALSGRGASPGIFELAVALGREKTLARLQKFIDRIPALLSS